MNPSSQVFFAAYSTGPIPVVPMVQELPRRSASNTPSPAAPSSESVDSLYARGACYRVDAGSRKAPVPPPHIPPAPPVLSAAIQPAEKRPAATTPTVAARVQPKPVPAQPVDVGYFDLNVDAQTSCLVFPPSLPELPVTFASEIGSEEEDNAATTQNSAPTEADEVELTDEPAINTPPVEQAPEPQYDEGWAATWEVDEFCWPEDAARLYAANQDYFKYAGEKLLDASREGLKVLAIAATREKEGCTTLAMCLAQGAASVGANVALIDGNLSNPELGVKLGLDFSRGWQDAHADEAPLAEAAVLSLADRITLFPLSATHRLATLSERKVSDLLRELSHYFDLVIVDAGTLPFGDALLFEAEKQCPVQAAMVVRDIRRSTESETTVTGSRLKSLGIEAIGIAENFTQAASAVRTRAA